MKTEQIEITMQKAEYLIMRCKGHLLARAAKPKMRHNRTSRLIMVAALDLIAQIWKMKHSNGDRKKI